MSDTIFIPAIVAFIIIIVCMAFFSGCYTLKQGFIMLGYLNRAVPLEDLPKDADDTQEFVKRITDIRSFAINELGLKDTKNYTRYVELDRDYLAAIVSASAKDSFTPYIWWFPVVGSVPYKGFFDRAGAKAEAAKLKRKDLDVLIRDVDAFSTLGWFSDPLYSYMKDYPVYTLADTIIHETLHATVYIKGQSQFDEELAEFVGTEGARLYMADRFGEASSEYKEMLDRKLDNAAFVSFIQALIRELEALYTSDPPPTGIARAEKLARKEAIIKAAQERFAADYEAMFKSDRYRFFAGMQVNNAYLGLFRLYYEGGDYLKDLYKQSGSALVKFIAAAKTIGRTKKPKEALEKALTDF